MAGTSRMIITAEVVSAGKTETVSTTFSNINPEISAKDFVACGNAFAKLCKHEPDYFKRVDTTVYQPDQFAEGGD